MGNLFNFDPVSMDSITSFANGKFAEGFEEALKRINDNFTRINGITPGKGDRGDSVVYVPVNFNFVWVAALCTNSNGNVALSNGKINMSTFNNWLSSIKISLSSEHIKILEDAWSDFEIFCSNANLAITDNTIKSYGSLCYVIYNEMVRVLLEWSGRDKLKPMYISDETLDEMSWILYDALWFCNDWKTEDYSAHAAPGVNLRTVLPYKKPGEALPELKSLVSKKGDLVKVFSDYGVTRNVGRMILICQQLGSGFVDLKPISSLDYSFVDVRWRNPHVSQYQTTQSDNNFTHNIRTQIDSTCVIAGRNEPCAELGIKLEVMDVYPRLKFGDNGLEWIINGVSTGSGAQGERGTDGLNATTIVCTRLENLKYNDIQTKVDNEGDPQYSIQIPYITSWQNINIKDENIKWETFIRPSDTYPFGNESYVECVDNNYKYLIGVDGFDNANGMHVEDPDLKQYGKGFYRVWSCASSKHYYWVKQGDKLIPNQNEDVQAEIQTLHNQAAIIMPGNEFHMSNYRTCYWIGRINVVKTVINNKTTYFPVVFCSPDNIFSFALDDFSFGGMMMGLDPYLKKMDNRFAGTEQPRGIMLPIGSKWYKSSPGDNDLDREFAAHIIYSDLKYGDPVTSNMSTFEGTGPESQINAVYNKKVLHIGSVYDYRALTDKTPDSLVSQTPGHEVKTRLVGNNNVRLDGKYVQSELHIDEPVTITPYRGTNDYAGELLSVEGDVIIGSKRVDGKEINHTYNGSRVAQQGGLWIQSALNAGSWRKVLDGYRTPLKTDMFGDSLEAPGIAGADIILGYNDRRSELGSYDDSPLNISNTQTIFAYNVPKFTGLYTNHSAHIGESLIVDRGLAVKKGTPSNLTSWAMAVDDYKAWFNTNIIGSPSATWSFGNNFRTAIGNKSHNAVAFTLGSYYSGTDYLTRELDAVKVWQFLNTDNNPHGTVGNTNTQSQFLHRNATGYTMDNDPTHNPDGGLGRWYVDNEGARHPFISAEYHKVDYTLYFGGVTVHGLGSQAMSGSHPFKYGLASFYGLYVDGFNAGWTNRNNENPTTWSYVGPSLTTHNMITDNRFTVGNYQSRQNGMWSGSRLASGVKHGENLPVGAWFQTPVVCQSQLIVKDGVIVPESYQGQILMADGTLTPRVTQAGQTTTNYGLTGFVDNVSETPIIFDLGPSYKDKRLVKFGAAKSVSVDPSGNLTMEQAEPNKPMIFFGSVPQSSGNYFQIASPEDTGLFKKLQTFGEVGISQDYARGSRYANSIKTEICTGKGGMGTDANGRGKYHTILTTNWSKMREHSPFAKYGDSKDVHSNVFVLTGYKVNETRIVKLQVLLGSVSTFQSRENHTWLRSSKGAVGYTFLGFDIGLYNCQSNHMEKSDYNGVIRFSDQNGIDIGSYGPMVTNARVPDGWAPKTTVHAHWGGTQAHNTEEREHTSGLGHGPLGVDRNSPGVTLELRPDGSIVLGTHTSLTCLLPHSKSICRGEMCPYAEFVWVYSDDDSNAPQPGESSSSSTAQTYAVLYAVKSSSSEPVDETVCSKITSGNASTYLTKNYTKYSVRFKAEEITNDFITNLLADSQNEVQWFVRYEEEKVYSQFSASHKAKDLAFLGYKEIARRWILFRGKKGLKPDNTLEGTSNTDYVAICSQGDRGELDTWLTAIDGDLTDAQIADYNAKIEAYYKSWARDGYKYIIMSQVPVGSWDIFHNKAIHELKYEVPALVPKLLGMGTLTRTIKKTKGDFGKLPGNKKVSECFEGEFVDWRGKSHSIKPFNSDNIEGGALKLDLTSILKKSECTVFNVVGSNAGKAGWGEYNVAVNHSPSSYYHYQRYHDGEGNLNTPSELLCDYIEHSSGYELVFANMNIDCDDDYDDDAIGWNATFCCVYRMNFVVYGFVLA